MSHDDRGRRKGKDRARPDRPTRVGDLLGALFTKLGMEEEVSRQEVLDRWAGVVGDRIAEVTAASAVSRGVLFVQVESSAWMNELNLMRHDILRRLNDGRTEGRVDRIVFSLSDGSRSPHEEGPG